MQNSLRVFCFFFNCLYDFLQLAPPTILANMSHLHRISQEVDVPSYGDMVVHVTIVI